MTMPDVLQDKQRELAFPVPEVTDDEVRWLLEKLEGRDWTTAAELLRSAGKPVDEDWKRWIRKLGEASHGRICGGLRGYKLTVAMTGAEFDKWAASWESQGNGIRERIGKTRAVRLRANL